MFLKIKSKFGRHCGVISKMRYFVPRATLIKYYTSNVKTTIQYGLLVHGCTSFANLNAILLLHKKFRMIYFKLKFDSFSNEFQYNGILSVHELFIYDLLKFLSPIR